MDDNDTHDWARAALRALLRKAFKNAAAELAGLARELRRCAR